LIFHAVVKFIFSKDVVTLFEFETLLEPSKIWSLLRWKYVRLKLTFELLEILVPPTGGTVSFHPSHAKAKWDEVSSMNNEPYM